MDPKDNTEPNGATDAQTNTPNAGTGDAAQSAGASDAPSLSPDNPTDTSAAGGQGQGAGQGVEVDLSALPDTPSGGVADSANPVVSDATTTPDADSPSLAFGATDATQPDASTVPPSDPAVPGAPGATPPATPDFGATPAPNNDQPIGSATPVPSVGADAGMPGLDVSAPAPGPDQPAPGTGISPTAPVPAHHGDKKTIIVLAGVAVILIVAIVVLFLL